MKTKQIALGVVVAVAAIAVAAFVFVEVNPSLFVQNLRPTARNKKKKRP
jgi:hypothetical protein